jgi:hypothetical protein
METTELNPKRPPATARHGRRRRARRFDPTQLFAQRDRLPWFWFFVAVAVTVWPRWIATTSSTVQATRARRHH